MLWIAIVVLSVLLVGALVKVWKQYVVLMGYLYYIHENCDSEPSNEEMRPYIEWAAEMAIKDLLHMQ